MKNKIPKGCIDQTITVCWLNRTLLHCKMSKCYINLICHQPLRLVKYVVIDNLLKIIRPYASSQLMKCKHSNNKRAFMYYSMWHMESLSVPLESECYSEWESFFPPWSLWSSPAISLIDAYENFFQVRCRGNSAMSCGIWDIPHSSLQCMGHCSLQIAHCVMPGPLHCLKAVIKLFPPPQEAVLCVSLGLLVANIRRHRKVLTLTAMAA